MLSRAETEGFCKAPLGWEAGDCYCFLAYLFRGCAARGGCSRELALLPQELLQPLPQLARALERRGRGHLLKRPLGSRKDRRVESDGARDAQGV